MHECQLGKTNRPPGQLKRPPGRFSQWCDRQVTYFERVPLWIVGTLLVGSLALGWSWILTDSWVRRLAHSLPKDWNFLAMVAALGTTVFPAGVFVFVIGRWFPAVTDVPSARIRE